VLWIAVVALVFSACGGGEESSPRDVPTATTAAATPSSSPDATPRSGRGDGDTLRLFYWQAPTTLNPHLSVGSKDQAASRIVYEPLATYDARGVMVPFLAAEIPSVENGGVAADGRSVTWKLRHGVNWADGEQFTADDVLFTYEYITNPQVGAATAGDYAGIERLEIIDDYTVRIHFKDVTPAWSDPFVGVRGMILPRHIFEPFAGANAAAAPANLIAIGTGPYMVSEYINEDTLIIGGDAVSTNRIIFTPNLYFREPNKPFFSAVELHGGGDAALAGQAVLVEGIADFAWNIQIEAGLLEQMLAVGKGVGVNPSAAFVEYILINFTDPNEQTTSGERSSLEYPHPFLTDERVRQAIAHAVDRDAIHALYGDTGPISTNVLTAPPQFESATPYPYPYDLERAKQLLDEAGWIDTNGDGVREKAGTRLRVTYQTSINPVRNATQEIVKAALEQIGFEVELKSIDASIFLGPVGDNTNTRRHFYADLEMFAYGGRSPDPGAAMQAWTCAQIAQQANNWGGANWGRYCNPEYDALYAQVVHELDPAKRQELFIQMNDLLIADVALIPIVKRPFTSAVANDITGLDPTPWDQDVWNIKDWRRT
jgi:peptide/nickel transport system substrate-binding protein